MSLFDDMMDEESKLHVRIQELEQQCNMWGRDAKQSHLEAKELKEQLKQCRADWSADSIKKTERIVELEKANDNCISLNLHASRMKALEDRKNAELQGYKDLSDSYLNEGKYLVECEECKKEVTANICTTDHFDNGETSGFTHLCEVCVLKEQLQAAVECIGQYHEYFKAIERGEYDNNRRSAPLRDFELILQAKALSSLQKEKGDVNANT